MGQAPSAPVLDKTFESDESKRVAYSVASMQGWRDSMEDSHTIKMNLSDSDQNAFFGVFDGHADERTVSKFAAENLWQKLLEHDLYASKDYIGALTAAFLATDAEISSRNLAPDAGGATAVSLLYTTDETLYVANVGDSRCVLSVAGEAKNLSTDHRPDIPAEKARIVKAGGFVSEDNRVNGLLAPSRALGDLFYKQRPDLPPGEQMVTAEPEIVVHNVTDADEFIILACDGIWDVLSSQQVVNSVRRQIADGASLKECCDRLLEACLSPSFGGIGCDNMTVFVIALLRGQTPKEWAAKIKERVEKGEGYQTPKQLPTFFDPGVMLEAKAHWENVRREREANEAAGTPGTDPTPIKLQRIVLPAGMFS